MKFVKAILIIVEVLFVGVTTVLAQQGTNASGGEAAGLGGSVSFTVGQLDYTHTTGSNGSITQGIQQPIEIVTITGVEEKHIHLTASVYPNPTTNFIILKIENFKSGNFTFSVCDEQGKVLIKEKAEQKEISISLNDLPNAIYFLNVSSNNREVKIFKIIKT
jgi:hypothetical protein